MPKKSGKTKSRSKRPKKASASAAKQIESSKQQAYKSFRITKRIKHPVKLPNVWQLTKTAALTLWQHKQLFIGIILMYGLLNLLLVQGLASGTDVTNLKHSLSQAFSGHLGSLVSSLGVFVVLVGSAGNGSSQTAGAYQLILGLVASLAVIWALRQVLAGQRVRVRDTFYLGMYPLVPFVLVLLVIGLQLVPLLIGSTLYTLVITNGIAAYFIEQLIWGLLYALLALLSLYMITSSLFALYIVTLPDMTPMKALRSARELVRYRRWTVLRKLICLPIILFVVAAIIMVPIIIWLTPLAQWVFFLLTMLSLVAIHTYMYTLYRELLNE